MGRWDTYGTNIPPHTSKHIDVKQFEDIKGDLLRICDTLRQTLSKRNPRFGDKIDLSNFCEYIANHSTSLNSSRL